MDNMGFEVEHIGASKRGTGDGGIDLVAIRGKEQDLDEVAWVISCKCYKPENKVGPGEIRDLIGALDGFPRGTRGMVVTTSTFTFQANQTAQRANIRLMDGSEFADRIGSQGYRGI